jgi:large subunit ribosomal protein L20
MLHNICKTFVTKLSQFKPTLVNSCVNIISRGMANQRHKKVLREAKGFHGRSNRCYTLALRRLQKARQYAFIGRKVLNVYSLILFMKCLQYANRRYYKSYS